MTNTYFPSEPGSIKWAFHQTGFPQLVYGLRKVGNNSLSKWIDNQMEFRSIGSNANDWGFYSMNITEEFDVLIYFDDTTATDLLNQYIRVPYL